MEGLRRALFLRVLSYWSSHWTYSTSKPVSSVFENNGSRTGPSLLWYFARFWDRKKVLLPLYICHGLVKKQSNCLIYSLFDLPKSHILCQICLLQALVQAVPVLCAWSHLIPYGWKPYLPYGLQPPSTDRKCLHNAISDYNRLHLATTAFIWLLALL